MKRNSPKRCILSQAYERASEWQRCIPVKSWLRNGGCPRFSGGRSDSPHRGIPQQHIMRLWWNQSLASCGWWLVGDPSVRPSVHISVRASVKRVSASLYLRSSSIVIETATRRSPTRHYSRVRRKNFGAENWTPNRVYHQTFFHLVLNELKLLLKKKKIDLDQSWDFSWKNLKIAYKY